VVAAVARAYKPRASGQHSSCAENSFSAVVCQSSRTASEKDGYREFGTDDEVDHPMG
jgi:hypothetical protein